MKDMVSVIIPVFNQEKYINECLKSVLNQTYENIEIIVLDDGSTDKSADIIKNIAETDNRIRFVKKNNTGVSDTRNMGVTLSAGKYIMFLDSDDWIETNTIEELVKKMNKLNVDVIRFNEMVYNKNSEKKYDKFYDLSNKKINCKNSDILFKHFFSTKENIPCYSPTLFMKKDVVPKFNINLKYMEDMAFYVELILNSNSIYFLDEYFYNYRFNENSVSKNPKKHLTNINSIIDSINYIKSIVDISYYSLLNILCFSLSIGKFDLFIYNKDHILKKQKKNEIKKIIETDSYLNIISNIDKKYLSFDKKIELFLLRKKMISVFIFVEKIKKLIKG